MAVGSWIRTGPLDSVRVHRPTQSVAECPSDRQQILDVALEAEGRCPANCTRTTPSVEAGSWRDATLTGWGPAMSDEHLAQRSQPAARRARCIELKPAPNSAQRKQLLTLLFGPAAAMDTPAVGAGTTAGPLWVLGETEKSASGLKP